MMGPSHVKTGVLGGLVLAVTVSSMTTAVMLQDWALAIGIAAGAAVVPDGDTKSSTFTHFFPPITVPLHWMMVWSHRFVYHMTRRPWDKPSFTGSPRVRYGRDGTPVIPRHKWRGAHRGLWHGIPTAVCVACAATLGAYALRPFSILFVICVVVGCVMLAGRGLRLDASLLLIGYVIVTFLVYRDVTQMLDHVMTQSWLWMTALGVGMIAHDLGDCPTNAGAPLWAPISWRKIRSPVPFKTGGVFERYVVRWALTGLIMYFGFLLIVG